jgi:hypothetical protein
MDESRRCGTCSDGIVEETTRPFARQAIERIAGA